METGNRLLMWLLFGVIIGSVAAAFILEYQAKQGAIAFIGLASTALGVLSPSPFQPRHTPTPAQDINTAGGDATITQTPPIPTEGQGG